jgi:hypothetical protein
VSYADLAERLEALGIKENERNIANKIARGSFTAVFSCNASKLSAARPST